jgi:hypothetical protein
MPIYSTLDNERKQGRTRRVSAFRQMKQAGVTRFHGYVREDRIYRVIAADDLVRELMPNEVPPYIVAHRDTCTALTASLPGHIDAVMSDARAVGSWDDLIFQVTQRMDMAVREPAIHASLTLGRPFPGFRVKALRHLADTGLVSAESMPGSHRVYTSDGIGRSMGELDVAPYIWGARDAYLGMVPQIESTITDVASSGVDNRSALNDMVVRRLSSHVLTYMERAALFFPPPVHPVADRIAS